MRKTLCKMDSIYSDPILYSASWLDQLIVNNLIGKKLNFEFKGVLICQNCNKSVSKFFGEGFCYNCFITSPKASPCILKPELCQAHLGIGRDVEWEEKNHNQPHIVYLAATESVKVGVTRSTQIPTRWIDQGASSAIIFAETPNRFEAGKLEVALKEFYTDKTNYKKMLQNGINDSIDLIEEKWLTAENLPFDLQEFVSENDEVMNLKYPVEVYPKNPKILTLDKVTCISAVLRGIKGQYLIFEDESVFNVRRHSGYEIEFSF